LQSQYNQMSTEALLELHSEGTLTDLAYDVLESELDKRGAMVPDRFKIEEGASSKSVTILTSSTTKKTRRILRTIAAFEVASVLVFILLFIFSTQLSVFDIILTIFSVVGGSLLWKFNPEGLMISIFVQAAYTIKIYNPSFIYTPAALIDIAYSHSVNGYGYGINFMALVLFIYLVFVLWKWRKAQAQ